MTKKILVTGATRGIGLAICERFAREGFDVVGIARKAVKASWPIVECDVGDGENFRLTLESIFSDYGTPDILVNNAGTYYGVRWNEQTMDQFWNTMKVNVESVFVSCKLFGHRLIQEKRAGSIVNISSVSGRIGSLDPAYAASKGAVDALTKSFARAFAPSNIRVNAIAPGPVSTDLASRIPEERKKEYVKSILQGRFGEPAEVANLAHFLANDDASLITGEIVYCTGGIL